MTHGIAGDRALADDLAAGVHRRGATVTAAEGAQIDRAGCRFRSGAPREGRENNRKQEE
jgi:hypothetical protein